MQARRFELLKIAPVDLETTALTARPNLLEPFTKGFSKQHNTLPSSRRAQFLVTDRQDAAKD